VVLSTIRLSISDARVADLACTLLTSWGYTCEQVGEATIRRIVARGRQALPAERFHELVTAIVVEGGALYGFVTDSDLKVPIASRAQRLMTPPP
jgi:hypothetical protein